MTPRSSSTPGSPKRGFQPSGAAGAQVAAWLKQAIAHHQAGRIDQAEPLYRQVLQQQPQNPDALSLLGVIACQRGQLEQGLALYRQALAIAPEHRQARENLNLALWKLGKQLTEEAIYGLNLMVNFSADPAQYHVMLGCIYQDQGAIEKALHHFQYALAAKPEDDNILNRIGVALQAQHKSNLAEQFHQRALAIAPNNVDALISMAKALQDQGDLVRGLSYLDRALALQPEHPIARYNRALLLLVQGDFGVGFPEYEWRFQTNEFPPCPFKQPKWDGSPLAGRTLLLHAEQGLGDTLQFIRYAAIATQKGGRVILTCHKPLIRLLSTIPGIEEIIPMGQLLPAFDVYVPLLSLPGVLGTTLETVPNQVPYLTVPPTTVQLPPAAIAHPRLKVGLVWSGGSLYKQNQSRSFGLLEFASLLDCPHVAFYSLQKGIPQLEIGALGWSSRVVDLNAQLNDMADTAAAIAQLDLVITVDTSVAHLAGALGKPVWVLLAHVPDWRWMLDRHDSPWYPTMRLFRQARPGDWAGVIQTVIQELQAIVA